MKLRRRLIILALIAIVLSTVRVHSRSPYGGTSLPRFRYVDVGWSGTPLYFRAGESTYDWRYMIFLNDRNGWGLCYLDDAAGKRIILSEATDPYYLIPALWIRRNVR